MIKLPRHISQEMKLYRMGLTGIPTSYVEYHKDLAETDIQTQSNVKILEDHGLVFDGWCDGFRVKSYTVAIKSESWEVKTLKWHESGAWFAKLESGGWVRELEMTNV